MEATPIRSDEPPLAFPAAVTPGAPPGFPLVAAIAPLIAAGAIWAITQSPFALVFAGLSPVIALAGVADGRRQTRRAMRTAHAERTSAVAELTVRVQQRQKLELIERRSRTPSAAYVMSSTGRLGRWTAELGRFATVRLGTGTVTSSVAIGGEAVGDDERRLQRQLRMLACAPIEVDARQGLALIGSPVLTRAMARGLLLQLVHAYPPDVLNVGSVPANGWEWAHALPHWAAEGQTTDDQKAGDRGADLARDARRQVVRVLASEDATAHRRPGDASCAMIVLAQSLEDLNVPCRIIVRVDGPTVAQVIAAPDRAASELGAAEAEAPRGIESVEVQNQRPELTAELVPELVSAQQAARYARLLAQHAHASGLMHSRAPLPDTVGFGQLPHDRVADTATSLLAVIGSTGQAPLAIDLVSDGPHAVVAGTTGSGKSELLTTWVAALAAAYPASAVGFLLVDFKGGSAFAPLSELPHCLGVITDLGAAEAERALRSLQAELRRRERMLAQWRVRSIAEAGGRLARLVIVVDEFAAMLEHFPELHALFVDIAARGRSLGVHTILCTQRPAGVVRDALLANCAVRISLRVHDAADSVAVIGSDAASRLSSARPGRCLVARDGIVEPAQIAETRSDDLASILEVEHVAGEQSPGRRPWLDPLPSFIALETVAAPDSGGVIVGIEDVPEEQRQSVVTLRPSDGHLLIVGVHGSGKSTAIETIAAQCAAGTSVVRGTEALWDTLERIVEASAERTGTERVEPRMLLIDDLDALVARMPADYQDAAMERLSRVLREGPVLGVSVVASVQRLTPLLRGPSSLFTSTLLLEQNDKHDYALAGGPPALYDSRHRPGAGVWRGNRMHVASAANGATIQPAQATAVDERDAHVPVVDIGAGGVIVVSRSPAARARALRASGITREVVELTAVGGAAAIELAETSARAIDVSGAPDTGSGHVIVGDPDSWQSSWSLFGTLKHTSTLLFDGCSVTDVRALLHTRELPPLIDSPDRVWVMRPGDRFRRGRMPQWSH